MSTLCDRITQSSQLVENWMAKSDTAVTSPRRIVSIRTSSTPSSPSRIVYPDSENYWGQHRQTPARIPTCTPPHGRDTHVLVPMNLNTPSKCKLSPSQITHSRIRHLERSSSFATIAPLSAPRFNPQTPVETDRSLKGQADTMTRLSLCDDDDCTTGSNDDEVQATNGRPKRKRCRSKTRRMSRTFMNSIEDISTQPSSPSPMDSSLTFDCDTSPSSPCPPFSGRFLFASPSTANELQSLSFRRLSRGASDSSPSSSEACPRSVTSHSPRRLPSTPLHKKYKVRDSGVAGMTDSDDDEDKPPNARSSQSVLGGPPFAPLQHLSSMRDSGFVTPGADIPISSQWPCHLFAPSSDNTCAYEDVDSFILKTLGGATSSQTTAQEKRMPHTPVKRHAYSSVGAGRPWQSTSKAERARTLNNDGGLFGRPRRSLPSAFTDAAVDLDKSESPTFLTASQSTSPLAGKDTLSAHAYRMLGLNRSNKVEKSALLRRLSSGSSFSSDLAVESTPTGPRGSRLSRPSLVQRRSTPNVCHSPASADIVASKFETELEVLDDLGVGEFGKVMKVKYRGGFGPQNSRQLNYAVKRSKGYEGLKHRQRCLEEVGIMKKLAAIGVHPHVLQLVDAWEEDEALYIQTELCELGNFAHFLAEFGSHFERLDEVRCWKILAQLSSGLRFIHNADVVHLDLKPENIFLAKDGRFLIGDFGMATEWPRSDAGFEREGDKQYLAVEVLRGVYGKAADVFSLGMTMLETAANIMVPGMGEPWQRLRREDFSEVDMPSESVTLFEVIKGMMRMDPDLRSTTEEVFEFYAVRHAWVWMDERTAELRAQGMEGGELFPASPLAAEGADVLGKFLADGGASDRMET